MSFSHHAGKTAGLVLIWTGICLGILAAEPMSVASLQRTMEEKSREILSFTVEGTVCSAGGKWVALQDASGTVLLECPYLPPGCTQGMRLRIEGDHCQIVRDRSGLRLGTAPVVDNDGHHSRVARAGMVYLEKGKQPLRMEWFNGFAESTLEVTMAGEGKEGATVPLISLFHRTDGDEKFWQGLAYETYTGNWNAIPDFRSMTPVTRGVTAGFDVGVLPQSYHAGAVFTGYLDVAEAGRYSFEVTSDDGSRFFIGEPRVKVTTLPERGEVVSGDWAAGTFVNGGSWVTAEGSVTFAAEKDGRLVLDLAGRMSSFQALVAESAGLKPETLLNQRVKLRGVGRRDGMVIVQGSDVETFLAPSLPTDLITEIGHVRRLQPEESRKPLRARLTGVVTTATTSSLVLQDSTGGVFIYYTPPSAGQQPRPGERWEVEGVTDPGDFSPMIFAERATYVGPAPMPEPKRPSWDQIASGSLDAELIEVEGVMVSTGAESMELLTNGGTLKIIDHRFHPLPVRDMDEAARADLRGSVVRIRGVFTANWDGETGRVNPGLCLLGNALMTVVTPAPQDPFAIPMVKAGDLLLFTSHSSRFKRVKVAGTVLHARSQELYLTDGGKGFRVVSVDAADLKPGDQVEVAGYPRLGGPSLVLLESHVRRVGHDPMPSPQPVDAARLPEAGLDATLVSIEAALLSDSLREQERVLEFQAGGQRFVARLVNADRAAKPIERGSIVRVTGVYVTATPDRAAADPFELLLHDAADLTILHRGPWWTPRHTMVAIAILSGGLSLALGWVFSLRRTVALRSRQLAAEIEERQASERHRELEIERTRVAQDLHDELGSGLTEAGILTSLVQNPAIPQQKKDGYLGQLAEVCRGLVTGLDEIVWAVNPRYDSVTDLAGYFSLFAQRFLDLAGIQCRLKIDDSVAGHPLDSSRRHGLFLAFREALNNIVRHSGATEVKLEIAVTGGRLDVSLADNGHGFVGDPDSPGSDGLAGMQSRMKKLGGTCRVDTNPGRGTTVGFSIPLEKNTP
ncbi:histidine kinase [Luteolibacter flavescens]|uniref:histidine kinase n=1 Tax=Luteolibacter flavescens TaxID=1859460 RepID=A0ABT3FW90_9BACT|nr:ATP-binding protein [Luteolibacter flavescens]MCW1887844.1 histidine kinase [Luteolibacter flavescens]